MCGGVGAGISGSDGHMVLFYPKVALTSLGHPPHP